MNQEIAKSHSGRAGSFPLLALFVLTMVVLILCATGCSSFPNVACDSWQHEGNYGPVTTHYQAEKVIRQQDGSLRIDKYVGAVKVLGGYGVTDTVQGLILTPSQAKIPDVAATKPEDK